MGRPISDVLDRLIARVVVVGPNGCWLWQGALDKDGYAHIWTRGKHHCAHRVVYERVYGRPIPPGLVIDHLCRKRHCLNPSHMETVTNEENVARGAVCRCGECARCRRNAYMRVWSRRRKEAASSTA